MQKYTEIQSAYDEWANIYDENINRTRDLESLVLKQMLQGKKFDLCLELGCGTGKNTFFLSQVSSRVQAYDFSHQMITKARSKISAQNVEFIELNLLQPWPVLDASADLIVFSLVLEHIEDLQEIFKKSNTALTKKGKLYIGELHPFKQYLGTKARFENNDQIEELVTFTHHVSEYMDTGVNHGFTLKNLTENFDDDNNQIPRILGLLFEKTE
ncbi:MAG: methyltransferase domain-containing protein [Saprospiraceae bacterium]|nr:methyltransferase domain-containing protein [Saprospiraceae bacterium]